MPKNLAPANTPVTYDWNTLKELNRKSLNMIWIEAFGKPIPSSLYKPIVIPLLSKNFVLVDSQLSPYATLLSSYPNREEWNKHPRVDLKQAHVYFAHGKVEPIRSQ